MDTVIDAIDQHSWIFVGQFYSTRPGGASASLAGGRGSSTEDAPCHPA